MIIDEDIGTKIEAVKGSNIDLFYKGNTMKKIVLLMAMSLSLMAQDLYIGAGGSFSDADEYPITCRGSGVILAGATIYKQDVFKIDVEGRVNMGMDRDYNVYEVFVKPQYDSFYGLLGYGASYIGDEKYAGFRGGIGYQFQKYVFFDIAYRESEDSFVSTLGFRYNF